ncbi:hypothetical protein J8TS2_35700 [Lederbergia ruris]|uniref:Uncharacterized protein n=1 Tax=Lederbergia ruris TaxID=217495 RepID=A0ABQ4KP22_9BACI|nr:hypothetical protein [Lederbergia ruris]GIN59251.1 hypothetical protein J8TS2_35700 [Lederbergia ruris]
MERIEVLLDHSYEDDYFMISTITVNLKNEEEKERVQKISERMEDDFVDPDGLLSKRIADRHKVDVSLIDLDTNEIDLM